MTEYTLVDCQTELVFGPYQTCVMARDAAEAEAIATWEIFVDGDALVDWSRPDLMTRPNESVIDPSLPHGWAPNKSAQCERSTTRRIVANNPAADSAIHC
jgi:hypothetical protein